MMSVLRNSILLGLIITNRGLGQSGTATINGETLSYDISGHGTPLVLVHGWSLDRRMWDPQILSLRKSFQVIRYDRRGFGQSSGNEDVSWDAADLALLLDHLKIRQAHLLGMSQGARVVLEFARDHPDRVLSLIVQGAPAPEGFGLQWSGLDRPRFDEWGAMARAQGLDAFKRDWAAHPLMHIPDNRPTARAQLSQMIAGYRGGRLLQTQSSSGPDRGIAMSDLSGITARTLVLTSDLEVPFLQIVARALAYYLPNARLEVVPAGGHLVNLIEPRRYNAAVLAFLKGAQQ